MNVPQLVNRYRVEILDDDIEPYLWGDDEVVNHLNDTIDELVEDGLLIVDQTTASVAEIKLVSNVHLYAVSDYILQFRSARLESNGTPLNRTTEDWLDASVDDWRDTTGSFPHHYAPSATKGYLSIYPKFDNQFEFTGSSNISFVASTKTISQATGDFSGLVTGDEVLISGTVSNNGYFTVATEGTTSFTVSETVVNESGTSAVIRKVMDTLLLSANRMPLTPFTAADISAATAITDIKAMHHAKLFNGMAKRAFLKPDSETYDKGKAEYHRQLFEKDKKAIRRTMILLKKPDKTFTIRSGSGIGN